MRPVRIRQRRHGERLVVAREGALPVCLDMPADLKLHAAVRPHTLEHHVNMANEVQVPIEEWQLDVRAALKTVQQLWQQHRFGDAC